MHELKRGDKYGLHSTETKKIIFFIEFLVKGGKSILSDLSQDMMAPQFCTPKRKIIFAKTHKTGSSTIQVK